jgi:hypothetical protein
LDFSGTVLGSRVNHENGVNLMSISGIGGAGAASSYFPTSGSNSASSIGASSPADEFLEYARQSPAERIRAAILDELGITEEDLENMPAAQREAMEKQIAEKLKEKIEQASEKKTGMIVDVTV